MPRKTVKERRKEAVERVEALSSHLAYSQQNLSRESDAIHTRLDRSKHALQQARVRLGKARAGLRDFLTEAHDDDGAGGGLLFFPDPKGPEREYWLAFQVVERIRFAINKAENELQSDEFKALRKEVSDTASELEKAKEEAAA